MAVKDEVHSFGKYGSSFVGIWVGLKISCSKSFGVKNLHTDSHLCILTLSADVSVPVVT